MGTRKSDKHQLLTRTCTNQPTSWLVHNLSTFGARMSHGQIWIYKIHHGSDLGEATTFPLIVYSVTGHRTNIQMTFSPGLPSGSPEIPKVGILVTLGAHNFICKPPIKKSFKTKLWPLSRAFQWYVARHLHVKKSGWFLTFSGRESNCQFDFRPFFWP
jgi:hypothetical protein